MIADRNRQSAGGATRRARLPLLLLALTTILVGLPVLTVIAHVFLPGSEVTAHLYDTVLPRYISNSLLLAVGVGSLTLVIGAGLAWLVTMHDFKGRGLFEWALILPLAAPAYVLAYAYTDFLDVAGPVQGVLRIWTGLSARALAFPEIRSPGGAIFVLTLAFYPYVYLAARAAFLQQCECVVEASRTLGATPFEAFRRVALPLARPALAAGVALALMETLADYGAVSYFGVQTFTTGIYRTWFSFGDRVAAAQLASMLFGFIALLMLLERWSRKGARYHDTSRRVRPLGIERLSGSTAVFAILACALPLTLGFLLPVGILVHLAWDAGAGLSAPRYLALLENSVLLATITALIAVLLALALSYTLRTQRDAFTRVGVGIAGMGYAIPGSIIAVGVLIPFAMIDRSVDHVMRRLFDIPTGLLLTGSIAALIFALLVRFLALAEQTTRAGLEKITPSMDAAAISLGASRAEALRRVHAPLLRAPILTAALLVFVEVIKELPATLIMRPFNFDTLAVQAHNLAADERLAEAATPALTILVIGLIPVLILSKMIARSRPGQTGSGAVRHPFLPRMRRKSPLPSPGHPV